jgi:hypothetical protein
MLLVTQSRSGLFLGALFLLVPLTRLLAADDVADVERVLVPVLTTELAGASGARWQTELWVFQTTEAFLGPIGIRECPPSRCGPPPPPSPLNDAFRPTTFRTLPGELPGVLLYVRKSQAEAVTFGLRASDVSRRELSDGVSIPVIRERDLISGRTAQLLNVPASATSRIRLRIYDPYLTTAAVVRVRVYDAAGSDVLLSEQRVALTVPAQNDEFRWPYPLRPASAELDIAPPPNRGDAVLRIEIEPESAGLRFWAFATITNNATNDVTVVVPD